MGAAEGADGIVKGRSASLHSRFLSLGLEEGFNLKPIGQARGGEAAWALEQTEK